MSRFVGLCAVLVGCYSPSFEPACTVHCDNSSGCPAQLQCDMADGLCKLPGGECPSDAGTVIDAAIDAEIDAMQVGEICYGTATSLYHPCFPGPPTQSWIIPSNPPTASFDTGGTGCDLVLPNNGSPLCVMYRTTVMISSGVTLRAHGTRALAIVASSISVIGVIDASSVPGGVFPQGAGGGWPSCPPAAAAASDIGGGAGGSFASTGGDGGNGNAMAMDGGRHGLAVSPTAPHGGCNGQIGSGNGGGAAPFGGGAVLLVSPATIAFTGGITVAGAGGTGGAMSAGGAGGGSGGLISFDAPAINPSSGWLVADGGGGGCGGTTTTGGLPGRTRLHGAAATGCAAPSGAGGDGTSNGGVPTDGYDGAAGVGGGGGGGGGGSIRFYGGAVSIGDRSPPATAPQ